MPCLLSYTTILPYLLNTLSSIPSPTHLFPPRFAAALALPKPLSALPVSTSLFGGGGASMSSLPTRSRVSRSVLWSLEKSWRESEMRGWSDTRRELVLHAAMLTVFAICGACCCCAPPPNGPIISLVESAALSSPSSTRYTALRPKKATRKYQLKLETQLI